MLTALVEALDAVVEEVETRDVVLDAIDALQVAVDDLHRRLELLEARGHRASPWSGARA